MNELKTKKNRACSVKLQRNRGMTYVELIVVLSIFATMTSIVLFNYGTFQKKVDIKNLANDIALKIVQAQKEAISGKNPSEFYLSNCGPDLNQQCKPSYGVDFSLTNQSYFIYFADNINVAGDKYYDNWSSWPSSCPTSDDECLEKIEITKGNIISDLGYYSNGSLIPNLQDLSITFVRPNSGAVIFLSGEELLNIEYAQITISSPEPDSAFSYIKIYPSGRIQIN